MFWYTDLEYSLLLPRARTIEGRVRMRVLVTGGSGRIGTVLIEALNERHEVIAYDRKKPERLPQGVVFAPGDILDREALRAVLDGVEAVVHLAGIPYDIPPLHEVFAINVQGTYNALELAVENGVEYFLHAHGDLPGQYLSRHRGHADTGWHPSADSNLSPTGHHHSTPGTAAKNCLRHGGI